MSLDSHYNCDCRHHSCINNAAVASAGCLRKMNCELVICYMLYNYNHKQQTQANMIKHEGKLASRKLRSHKMKTCEYKDKHWSVKCHPSWKSLGCEESAMWSPQEVGAS